MPTVANAFLCSAAEERGGVVYILSAFVDQVSVASMPARQALTLVANLEIQDSDFDNAHLIVVVVNFEDGENIARIELGTPIWPRPQVIDPDLGLKSNLIFPMNLELRRQGLYRVVLNIDGNEVASKPLKVTAALPQM